MIILSVGAYRFWKRLKVLRETQRRREELDEIIRGRSQRNSRQQISAAGSASANATNTQENIDNHTATDPQSNSPSSSAQTCVVCLNEQREVILMDCGHVCVCAGCAIEIMARSPQCPVCRANIDRVAPAFIA